MLPEPLPAASRFAVVVNDDPTQLNVLAGLVRKAGLEPRIFTGAEAALAALSAGGNSADRAPEAPPALIVTDLYMPGLDGWRFCRLLRSPEYAACNQIPILVVSATFSGAEASRIATDLGVEAFLPSPVDGPRFCAQVQAILNGQHVRNPLRVLIVDDNVPFCDLLKEVFASHGYEAEAAHTVRTATAAFRQTAYDVAVLDYHLPDGAGDVLLDTFRAQQPDCVCLMITIDTGPEQALEWMKRGAAAYLQKPFKLEYLIELCARARRERVLLRVQDLLEVRTRELQKSEERYRTMVENSGEGIGLVNAEEQFVFANSAAEEIFGVGPGGLGGRNLKQFVSAAQYELLQQQTALRVHGKTSVYELEVVRPNGERRDIIVTAVSQHDKENGFVGTHGVFRDITQRKKAETEAAANHLRLLSILDANPDPVYVADPATYELLYANRAIVKSLGAPDGRKCYEYLQHRNAPCPFCTNDKILGSNFGQDYVWEFQNDINRRWYRCLDRAFTWPDGRIVRYEMAIDITKRKEAEELLRQQGEQLRLLYEASQRLNRTLNLNEIYQTISDCMSSIAPHDGLLISSFDPQTQFITCRAYATKNGWQDVSTYPPIPLEAAGQGTQSVAIRTGQSLLLNDYQTQLQTARTSYNINDETNTVETEAGPEEEITRSALVVPLKTGDRVSGVLQLMSYRPNAYTADQLKLLEALALHIASAGQNAQLYTQIQAELHERQRAEARIREQAALLDKAADAIYVRAGSGEILYWNQGAERLYGWTQAEVLGRKITDLNLELAGPAADLAAHLRQEGNWAGEKQQTTKTGRAVTVFARLTVVKDEQGQPATIFAIDTDITEQKKLEIRFLQTQRLENLGALASGIAHDLNNVLTPVLMATEILKGSVGFESERSLIATLEICAQRGANVVRQILTFARGIQGERVPLLLRHLVGEMVDLARETFPRNIKIEMDFAQALWPVVGDATQLHQILMNLCINARDAMPAGGQLTLAAENFPLDETFVQMTSDAKVGPYVCLKVADTGMGIAPENFGKIFEPFLTTKAPGKGTGLGLATVLSVVKNHGGFTLFKSVVGRGTCFEIYLPAAPDAHLPADGKQAPKPPRGQGELILVVDDESAICAVASKILEAHGYRVLAAADGSDALLIYLQNRAAIAAVVTDMLMPGMDGPTLVRLLRRTDPAIRVVGITGNGENTDTKTVEALALSALLIKPFTADKLLWALHKALPAAPGTKVGGSAPPWCGPAVRPVATPS